MSDRKRGILKIIDALGEHKRIIRERVKEYKNDTGCKNDAYLVGLRAGVESIQEEIEEFREEYDQCCENIASV